LDEHTLTTWETVIALHTAIKELQDEIENPDSILNHSNAGKRNELGVLLRNCSSVLQQLNKLLIKYKSLGTTSKRTWDRLMWGKENLAEIREKLMMHTSTLTLFLTTLGTRSLGRIEKKLDEILEEVRAGKRDGTILTISDDDEEESENQWRMLKSELVEDGLSKFEIEGHKHWIKGRLLELIENGGIDQEPSPEHTKSSSFQPTVEDAEVDEGEYKSTEHTSQHPKRRSQTSNTVPYESLFEQRDGSTGSEHSELSGDSDDTFHPSDSISNVGRDSRETETFAKAAGIKSENLSHFDIPKAENISPCSPDAEEAIRRSTKKSARSLPLAARGDSEPVGDHLQDYSPPPLRYVPYSREPESGEPETQPTAEEDYGLADLPVASINENRKEKRCVPRATFPSMADRKKLTYSGSLESSSSSGYQSDYSDYKYQEGFEKQKMKLEIEHEPRPTLSAPKFPKVALKSALRKTASEGSIPLNVSRHAYVEIPGQEAGKSHDIDIDARDINTNHPPSTQNATPPADNAPQMPAENQSSDSIKGRVNSKEQNLRHSRSFEIYVMERPLVLTLEELFKGCKKKLDLTLEELFEGCEKKSQIKFEEYDDSLQAPEPIAGNALLEIDIKPGALKSGSIIKLEGFAYVENRWRQDLHFIVEEVSQLARRYL
jgi:hypothetical protein